YCSPTHTLSSASCDVSNWECEQITITADTHLPVRTQSSAVYNQCANAPIAIHSYDLEIKTLTSDADATCHPTLTHL
ncbi:hypothetical protein SARC_18009, partial [Sphaeroforma arctica JP610]